MLLTGESHGYYRDYQRAPLHDIARALGSGFVYQGEASAHRGGVLRGEPSRQLAPIAFVNFLQNHDQIGNRALGDRLAEPGRRAAVEAALAITLLAPAIPMLFMGEEWGSKAPFPFFCDFHGDSRTPSATAAAEFAGAYAKYGDEVPDPLDPAHLPIARYSTGHRATTGGKKRLALVGDLLAIRRREIVPRLAGAAFGDAQAADDGLLTARLAHGRRRDARANGQSVAPRR